MVSPRMTSVQKESRVCRAWVWSWVSWKHEWSSRRLLHKFYAILSIMQVGILLDWLSLWGFLIKSGAIGSSTSMASELTKRIRQTRNQKTRKARGSLVKFLEPYRNIRLVVNWRLTAYVRPPLYGIVNTSHVWWHPMRYVICVRNKYGEHCFAAFMIKIVLVAKLDPMQ